MVADAGLTPALMWQVVHVALSVCVTAWATPFVRCEDVTEAWQTEQVVPGLDLMCMPAANVFSRLGANPVNLCAVPASPWHGPQTMVVSGYGAVDVGSVLIPKGCVPLGTGSLWQVLHAAVMPASEEISDRGVPVPEGCAIVSSLCGWQPKLTPQLISPHCTGCGPLTPWQSVQDGAAACETDASAA